MPSPDSIQQRLKWVLVPNGVNDEQELVFSVFLAPAMTANDVDGPPTLATFPDFLDWPTTLAGISFQVELSNGSIADARVLPGERSSDLWQRLFPATTGITPFAGDALASRPVMTFSVPTLVDSLRQSYATTILQAIDDLPVIAPPPQGLVANTQSPFADIARIVRDEASSFLFTGDEQAFTEGFNTLLSTARAQNTGTADMAEVLPSTGESSGEYARAVVFHRGPRTVPVSADDPAARLQAMLSSVDFHRTLTSLQEHSTLLRRLGLVFDIAIPRTAVSDSGGAARLLPQWTSQLSALPVFAFPTDSPLQDGPSVDERLWVEWQLNEGHVLSFTAVSGSPPGLLDIGVGSDFRVEHLAVDGAALQSVTMMSGLPPEGAATAPPALRSGGLMLLQAGRARATHGELAAATDAQRGADRDHALRAEDLVRAYRLDVFDAERERWFSLHARRVEYSHLGSALLEPVEDEGAFQPAATGPHVEPGVEAAPTAPLYLHESLTRWDGWSLSAPRPGRSLSVDPSGPDPDRPETMPQRVTNDPLTATGLQIETRVQNATLPRLRFGSRYRLRVRTVDLAGNGMDLAGADRLWAMPFIAQGEEGAQIPARDFGSDEVTFSRFEPVGPPAVVKANVEEESAHRLVVRSAMDEDVAATVDTTGSDECQLFAPKGSVELAERHGMFDDAIGTRDSARLRASYDLAARESGILPDAGDTSIPYLPDPLAVGIAIAGAPGMPAGITFAADWDPETWDTPQPITLRLLVNDMDFQPGPDWDEATRTVIIKLDAARRARIRISSKVPEGTPFGLLDWCRDAVDETTLLGLQRAVDQSRHCMFTPWVDVELVHAVQRPLAAPDLEPTEEAFRNRGDTDYRCLATLLPEPLSMGSLSLSASWKDWVDDPSVEMRTAPDGTPPTWTKDVRTDVGSIPLAEPKPVDGVFPLPQRMGFYGAGSTMPALEFADTKHRRVTFQASAATRFAEHFPPRLSDEPARLAVSGLPVEYVVASTAPPPAPVVLDVVPLVVRSSAIGAFQTRRREGGWLRIFLARPWFTTGEGEQLGIVVADQTPANPHDPMYDLVSLLGTDLAHFSSFTTGLQTSHLENAVPGEIGFSILPESIPLFPDGNPPTVSILHFDPKFDETSQRWYVDVRVNVPDAYFPIVRLAVVRLQPNSISDCTISPVVLLDPVPLLPDRELTVHSHEEGGPLTGTELRTIISLRLTGATYTSIRNVDGADDSSPAARARVTARTQRKARIDLAPGDGWVTTGSFSFSRHESQPAWLGGMTYHDIHDVDPLTTRLLIVEEDHLPFDPAAGQEQAFAPRVVFAEAVDVGPIVIEPFEPPPEPPPPFE